MGSSDFQVLLWERKMITPIAKSFESLKIPDSQTTHIQTIHGDPDCPELMTLVSQSGI